MAAKPKLTPEQWLECRHRWEADHRDGYQWLSDEMNLPVSSESVRQRAKKEGWRKASSLKSIVSRAHVKADAKLAESKLVGKLAETSMGFEACSSTEAAVESRPVGRPSLYREQHAAQAYKLALLGLIDAEMAEFFEVDESTLHRWKLAHPEFRQALLDGKEIADADVAAALYKSAIGGHILKEERAVSDGKGGVTIVTVERRLPPDVQAQSFMLKNRRPKQWKDKIELKEEINLNVFPPKEVLDALYAKSLAASTEQAKKLVGRRERLGIVIDGD